MICLYLWSQLDIVLRCLGEGAPGPMFSVKKHASRSLWTVSWLRLYIWSSTSLGPWFMYSTMQVLTKKLIRPWFESASISLTSDVRCHISEFTCMGCMGDSPHVRAFQASLFQRTWASWRKWAAAGKSLRHVGGAGDIWLLGGCAGPWIPTSVRSQMVCKLGFGEISKFQLLNRLEIQS